MEQDQPRDGEAAQQSSHPEDIPILADQPNPDPTGKVASADGENENDKRIKWADRWMVRLTAILAVCALSAVIVSYLQWSAMRDQLKEMATGSNETERMIILTIGELRAAARSAKAAEDAATQAKRQVAVSHEQMVRDQRAWIGAHIHMDTPAQSPYFFTYSFVFKNYGKSPAIGVLTQDSGEVFGVEFPKHPKYYKPANPLEVKSKSALFPGDSGEMPGTAHIRPEQLAEIMAGKKWFYSYAIFTYKDIFGQSHTTHVCFRHGMNPPDNKPRLCDTYNDAD